MFLLQNGTKRDFNLSFLAPKVRFGNQHACETQFHIILPAPKPEVESE